MLKSVYFRVSFLMVSIALPNFASYAPQSEPKILYWTIPSNIFVHKASYSPSLLAICNVVSLSIYREY